MGMTKTSDAFNPDGGFKAPRKEPTEPRVKKARCTFEMFSSTDWQEFRLCCHHRPRHLACDCVFMAVPPTSVVAGVKGPDPKLPGALVGSYRQWWTKLETRLIPAWLHDEQGTWIGVIKFNELVYQFLSKCQHLFWFQMCFNKVGYSMESSIFFEIKEAKWLGAPPHGCILELKR